MTLLARWARGVALVLALTPAAACAQATPPAVGTPAPSVSLVTATKAGPGRTVTLADYAGKTIVLAFFYKARTGG